MIWAENNRSGWYVKQISQVFSNYRGEWQLRRRWKHQFMWFHWGPDTHYATTTQHQVIASWANHYNMKERD